MPARLRKKTHSKSRSRNAANVLASSSSSSSSSDSESIFMSNAGEDGREEKERGRCEVVNMKLKRSPLSKMSGLREKTLTWENIPEWMRDNQYIRSGYRRQQNSWKGCFKSVFGYLHNETVNIQTHLWGAVFFACLLIITLSKTMQAHSTVTWHDIAGFVVFLLAAITCLSLSAMFHTASCHSLKVAKDCVMFDYAGILTLIVGSFFPSVYYGFYCYPTYQRLYLGSITLAGLGSSYVVLTPRYNTPEYRWARTSIFIALGFTGLVPVSHAVWLHGLETLRYEMGINWLLLSGALYTVGALLYAARWPERFFPGKLDYFGASHQLFHINVVLAAVAHYVSIYTAYNHQHGTNAGTCPAATLPLPDSLTT